MLVAVVVPMMVAVVVVMPRAVLVGVVRMMVMLVTIVRNIVTQVLTRSGRAIGRALHLFPHIPKRRAALLRDATHVIELRLMPPSSIRQLPGFNAHRLARQVHVLLAAHEFRALHALPPDAERACLAEHQFF